MITLRPVPETGEYEVVACTPPSAAFLGPRFRTDGASVPRLLWPVLGSPFDPALIEAAVYHDAGYRAGLPRGATDALFLTTMLSRGVHPLRARLLWLGVRAIGWLYWRRCRVRRGIAG